MYVRVFLVNKYRYTFVWFSQCVRTCDSGDSVHVYVCFCWVTMYVRVFLVTPYIFACVSGD